MDNKITDEIIYNHKVSIPNKLLNADGSITDFQGNIIEPPSEDRAIVYKARTSLVNKFMDTDGESKTYAQISLEIFVPVEVLPETGEKNKIYLVPAEDGMFDEYFYNSNGKWDKIGAVSLDLSKYWTIDEVKAYVDSQVKDVLGGEY